MKDPGLLFDIWYVRPLEALREMPEGAGGFVALATSCLLYERYAAVKIRDSNPLSKVDTDTISDQLSIDFDVDKDTAASFWRVMRHGLLHRAMPKTETKWRFDHSYQVPMRLCEYNGKQLLEVEPWRFMDKVISLWQENMDLLARSKSSPWAYIEDDE